MAPTEETDMSTTIQTWPPADTTTTATAMDGAATTAPAPEVASAAPERTAASEPGLTGHTAEATRGRWAAVVRGPQDHPAWARPALLALLAATALLYLWNLGASGYGNSFYAAAVQAGSQDWKAFLFGSFDSSNYITVDKPPASLWVMALSARIFGFSSWSLLAPQALEGVAAVALLYGAVRRVAGHGAGLAAGALLALTPAAVLMFRFDNPDALLTLLLTASAYAVTRAVENGRTRWLVLAGTCVGFAFLTKMGQAFLVLPGLGLAYLLAGPPRLGRRILQLVAALSAVIVSAGWWVALVELWPADSRPYIGGSTTNSVLELAFGYNGLGRIFGGSGNGGGGGGGAGVGGSASAGFGGATGLTRLFTSEFGQEIGWLLPAALLAIPLGLWLTRRHPRTDPARAAVVVWGGWLVVTGLVLSFMAGTVHPYYAVVLAPAVAALVAIVGRLAWQARRRLVGVLGLAAMIAATALMSVALLNAAGWHPELRYVVIVAGSAAVFAVLSSALWRGRLAGVVAGVMAATVALAGAGAIGLATASMTHSGSIPSVGAVSTSAMGGPGGAPGGGPGGGTSGSGMPGGTPSGAISGTPSGTTSGGSANGDSATSDSALVTALRSSTTRWAAAASSSMTAGPLELASGAAVMSIGGFNGSDSAITLEQFKALVAAGQIHYFIADGMSGGPGGPGGGQSSAWSSISAWVTSTYTATTLGGTTVYDLTASA